MLRFLCDAALTGKRLYLPKAWTDAPERLEKAGVPEAHRKYKSHADLALELIAEADANGARYRWIGLDAEFGTPSFLRKLAAMKKTFLVDVHRDQMVYMDNPTAPPVDHSGDLIVTYAPKPIRLDDLVERMGMGPFRTYQLGEKTRRNEVRILHQKVWLWDGEEKQAHPWHLVVRLRQTRSKREFKYSLSNAHTDISAKHLAIMQSQRYLIEQSFRDHKQEVGLADYQVRGWAGWHKHVTMTLIAGVYVLSKKIQNVDLGLLTFGDVCEALTLTLVDPEADNSHFVQVLEARHRRHAAVIRSKRKKRIKKR